MKKVVISLFIIFSSFNSNAKNSQYKIASDSILSKTLLSRNYQLIGSYFIVQKEPLIKYAKILKNDKWGYVDFNGTEVIKPIYSYLNDFKNGLAKVKYFVNSKNGDYSATGLIDVNGNLVTKYDYEFVSIFYPKSNLARVKRNGKWGVINNFGKEVVLPSFDDIQISDKYIFAKSNGLWALLDPEGNPFSEFEYDEIKYGNQFIIGYKNKKISVLNPKTGLPFNSMLWDYIDIEKYSTTKFHYIIPEDNGVLVANQGEISFLIDKNGNKISNSYKSIYQCSLNFFCAKNEQLYGLMNKKGKLVIKEVYDFIGPYENESCFWAKKGEILTIYDNKFNLIKTSQFDYFGDFKNGICKARIGDKCGVIDTNFKIVIPFVYSTNSLSFGMDTKKIIMNKNNFWGVIDRKEKIIIPFEYNEIYSDYFNDDYLVAKNHKHGLLNSKGRIIIPLKYASTSFLFNKRCIVSNEKYGIVDTKNKIIVPLIYDFIYFANEKVAEVTSEKLKGFVNLKTGKLVAPIIYNQIYDLNNGLAQALRDLKNYYIDCYGNEYETDEFYQDEY